MKKQDIEHWERKEIYDYMTTLSNPFHAVSFNIDVTNIYEYAHRKGLSFYYSLIFLATQAFNSVPAFLNDIQNGEIIVLDHRSPSFCDIRKTVKPSISSTCFSVTILMTSQEEQEKLARLAALFSRKITSEKKPGSISPVFRG